MKWMSRLLPVLLLLFLTLSVAAESITTWRSSLYPVDWEPGYADAEGRFLHDFSYAGYHAGEKPLPTEVSGKWADVTQPPYNADNTGKVSASRAIQQAINDVGLSGGGTVYLPEGTYRLTFEQYGVNSAIFITYSNVVLQGAGADKTFLFLDEKVTRNKTMISIKSVFENFSWQQSGSAPSQALREDMSAQQNVVPLAGPPQFNVGDWVVVQYDVTEEWIAEHNMSDGWDSAVRGPSFFRRVVAVDRVQNTITLDAPVRYAVKVRDNGRVYKTGEPLQEIGLADFSIGMREHPSTTGWGSADHSNYGTGAYDVHGSIAVLIHGVVNGWVRDVATYKLEENRWAHIHSIGFYVDQSRHVTLRRVSVENPQYRGGNGNGYPFVVAGQDCLYDDLRAVNGRHNFTITTMKANGNVIYRSYISNPIQSLSADFHAHLSMANLIDNLTVDRDRFDAVDRSSSSGVSGFPKHGVTTTASVFWNTEGLAYRYDLPVIVHSQQYGWGYVIGSRGPAAKVMVSANERTEPVDFLEGEGLGAGLQPQSLYVDQLERRLRREGKLEQWETVKASLTPPEIRQSTPITSTVTAQPVTSVAPVSPIAPITPITPTTPIVPDTQLPLIHSQDFESVNLGELPEDWDWLLTSNSPDKPVVATDPIDRNNQVLALSRTANTNNLTGRAYMVFDPVKERLQISFRMLATTELRALRLTVGGTANSPANVHGSATYAGIYFITNRGQFRALRDAAANSWVYAGNYTPGTWVKATLDIDIANQTMEVYINDAVVPSNIEPILFLTPYSDLNTLCFGYQSVSSENNTAPMYIDDVVVLGR
ncbi:MAG TPA: hypothetical protein GXZ82_10035 [Firmicutes bacterium]|nr:hypothetical protein [Bacillota bacterium]